jgi:hypothetical protein
MPELVARPVRLRHPAPFPSAFQHVQVAMPAAPGVDAHAVVVDLADEVDPALVDAAVRRHWWSADHRQLAVRRATARELLAEGAPVLRTSALGWVDPAERSSPGFPLASDADDVPRGWVPARRRDPSGSAEGWMPYTAAVARPADARPDEPLTHPPLLGGFGAGTDSGAAFDAAWRASVVDDALWCWWVGLVPAASVDPTPEVRRLWGDADLDLTLRHLDHGSLAPVTLAVVDDGVASTVGGGFGQDAVAQRTAIARALWQLAIARRLDDPAGALTAPGVVPHRADRRYAPDSVIDRRRLLDPLAHVQLALDPRVRTRVRRHLDEVVAPAGEVVAPAGAGVERSAETWTVSLAPGGDVVRVLSPAAVPLPLGAFRLDPALVARVARRAGRTHAAAAEDLPPFPGW